MAKNISILAGQHFEHYISAKIVYGKGNPWEQYILAKRSSIKQRAQALSLRIIA
jgi:hypothetical protein